VTARYDGGLRVNTTVAGDRERVDVQRAVVSTGTAKTIVSAEIAKRVSTEHGARACLRAPFWLDPLQRTLCSATVPIDVAIAGCAAARVHAVVASEMPRGVDVVLGRDAQFATLKQIDFGPTTPMFTCRRSPRTSTRRRSR
jgi:hypothetical protein